MDGKSEQVFPDQGVIAECRCSRQSGGHDA